MCANDFEGLRPCYVVRVTSPSFWFHHCHNANIMWNNTNKKIDEGDDNYFDLFDHIMRSLL